MVLTVNVRLNKIRVNRLGHIGELDAHLHREAWRQPISPHVVTY
jgi:hypothetical protein